MDSFPWWPEGLNPLDSQVEEAFHSSVQLAGQWPAGPPGGHRRLDEPHRQQPGAESDPQGVGQWPDTAASSNAEASEDQGSRPRHSGREVDGQTADRGA